MVELRSYQSYFESAKNVAEMFSVTHGATQAQVNAEAAMQAINSMGGFAALLHEEELMSQEEYQNLAEELGRKEQILRESRPLNSLHAKFVRKDE
jgi:hypothetical protein